MTFKRFLISLAILTLSGCGGKHPPDVTALQLGSTLLQNATILQKGITAKMDARELSVPLATQLSAPIEKLVARAPALENAVKAYHAATTGAAKAVAAKDVQALLTEANALMSTFLNVTIPPGVSAELTKLAATVLSTISSLQLEFARGLGVTS